MGNWFFARTHDWICRSRAVEVIPDRVGAWPNRSEVGVEDDAGSCFGSEELDEGIVFFFCL